MSPKDQKQYRDGVHSYRTLLLICDAVTATTQPLVRASEALGIPAHIIPNSWNTIQHTIADRLLAEPSRSNDNVLIGYFSGSRTRDSDFAEVAPILLRLMKERPNIRLRIAGFLDLGTGWEEFNSRIERLPFQPSPQMLRTMRECDVNLAPLEQGNPFNEAKSELKWFEAALVEVPTVATPTEPFRAAIEDGVTGLLAGTPDVWYQSLDKLCADRAYREELGRTARRVALERFGPETVGTAAEAAYGLVTPGQSTVSIGSGAARKRIDWIVPGLLIGGGGHRNIIRAAHFLERFGHDVALHFVSTDQSAEELKHLINVHFYPFSGEVTRYNGIVRYSDALLATHWSTVEPALDLRGMTQEVMYFVQDFEPLFAPMGTEYILAENTYRKGLYCITSGPWCARILRRQFGVEADHFDFPIDRSVSSRERSKRTT